MAIKILITLEGSEGVKSSLNEMAKSGEAFMQQFEGLSAKAPLAQLSSDLEKVNPAIESTRQITRGFAESLRVVIPSLRLAGVEVGNFTGFARLASVGILGLAGAITGALVVALAGAEEASARTRASLNSLFGSKGAGATAFADLQAAAAGLDTTMAGLAPALDSLTRAWQNFVQSTQGFKFVALRPEDLPVGRVQDLVGVTQSFVKMIRAAGQDEAAAEKIAKSFFDTLKQGGKVTRDALEQLDNRTVQLFAEAMGRGSISAAQFRTEVSLAPIPLDRALQALSRFKPQADQAFETEAVKSFKDEFQGLLNDIEKASKQKFGITVDQGLINFIKDLRKEVPGTANDLKGIANGLAPLIKLLERFRTERQLAARGTGPVAPVRILPPNFKQITDDAQKAADQTESIFSHAFDNMIAGTSPFAQAIGRALDQLPEHAQQSIMMIPVFWEELKTNSIAIFNNIVAAATPIIKKLVDVFAGIPAAVMDIWNTFISDISESWDQITESAQSAYDAIVAIFTQSPIDPKKWATSLQSWFDNIIAGFKSALTQIKQGIISPAGAAEFTGGSLLQQQQEVAQQQQQAAQTQPLVAPFQEADNQIRTIWIDLLDYISTSLTDIDFTPLTQALVAPFTNALPGIRDALLQVENMIREIVRQALEAGQIIQQLNQGGRPGGGGGGGFIEIASGGYIRGPGTTTSDSIPAWLSNREYVIQAKAVDHYGASLFAALNSMRLPKDLFGHFALGGLAKALASSMPKYAVGGMATATASSGRSLTIVLDGQRFGLNGSADVIDKLERVATMAGIASIGRPPGWVR